MGCGASSANGRDKYATLSPDPEPLTPLVGSRGGAGGGSSSGGLRFDDNLNDFLTPHLDVHTADPYISTKKTAVKKNRDFPVAPGYETATTAPKTTAPRSSATRTSTSTSRSNNTPSLAYSAANSNNRRSSGGATTGKPKNDEDYNDYSFSDLRTPAPLEAPATSTAEAAFSQPSNFAAEKSDDTPPPPSPAPPSVQADALLHHVQQHQQESLLETGSGGQNSKTEHKSKKKKKKDNKRRPSTGTTKSTGSSQMETSSKSRQHQQPDTPLPDSKSGMRFDELYRLKGVLGTGAFSTVREGYHRSNTDNTYAVKCVNRKKLSEEDEAALLDEVAILQEMKHVHIIRLYDFFVEPQTYYLVMERMSGGELFDRIVAKAYYNEKEARDVCKILLEAVGYCHQNNVAHRDLKPENLLLLSEDDDSTVKIADFGFAKKVFTPRSLTTQCGTPGYVAPEILEGIPYDTRADMWSVGVILYILLGGYPPFIENNQRDLFRKIRRGDYEFHDEYWGTVSNEAKELISSLLTVDPMTRLDAEQALDNPWIRGDDDDLAKRDLGANLKELTKFNAKRKFKAAVSTVMAVNKLKSLGEDFLRNLS